MNTLPVLPRADREKRIPGNGRGSNSPSSTAIREVFASIRRGLLPVTMLAMPALAMSAVGCDPTDCSKYPEEDKRELLFICEKGKEKDVTAGINPYTGEKVGAMCVGTDNEAYQVCPPAIQNDPDKWFVWDEAKDTFVFPCVHKCTEWDEKMVESGNLDMVWCYNECDAANGQPGVYCLNDNGTDGTGQTLFEAFGDGDVCWQSASSNSTSGG